MRLRMNGCYISNGVGPLAATTDGLYDNRVLGTRFDHDPIETMCFNRIDQSLASASTAGEWTMTRRLER